MGNFTREFIARLRKEGFDPVVVDKRRHKQIFIDGQLIATHPTTGKQTMRWQKDQAESLIHRLKRREQKGTRDG
jgi:hypothetical protein